MGDQGRTGAKASTRMTTLNKEEENEDEEEEQSERDERFIKERSRTK